MKQSIFIFLLHFAVVFGLKGPSESICYNFIRVTRTIEIGPGEVQTIFDKDSVEDCCDGYKLQNDECVPQCDPACVNGTCAKPNVCTCFESYAGVFCDRRKCPAGFEGADCDRKCSRNTYGEDCARNCTCQNGDCDPTTGYCSCQQGWSGVDCSVRCSDGMHCLNDGVCAPGENYCICPPGYTGQFCEEVCEENLWGNNCSQACYCEDNHICNPVDGQCQYNCVNGEYFDHLCWCNDGWSGEFCTEKLCPPDFYGENCDYACSCQDTTTKSCDRVTGACICKPGWTGDRCERACPAMTFGQNCNYTCECVHDRHNGCDPVSGICDCKTGWTGETCNKICTCQHGLCDSYGNCICFPGWQGTNCQEECDDGYYGDGCSDVCALYYDTGHFVCDPVRGPTCAPGYTGSSCTELCPDGTYGTGCKNCSCESYFVCDRFTGSCECPPGWYGSKCDIPCPTGTYGYKCDRLCKCPNCRQTDGYCACQSGWNSSLCRDYCPEEFFDFTLNQCVEIKSAMNTETFTFFTLRAVIICGIVILVPLFLGFGICIYRKYARNKSRVYDGRVEYQSNLDCNLWLCPEEPPMCLPTVTL